MKYCVDHDLHIHSYLSACSGDPLQTPENILRCAERKGFHTICLTDHFWDSTIAGASRWYRPQDYKHILRSKPLPQSDKVRFLFGCEAETTRSGVLGVSPAVMQELSFIVIATTHFHIRGFTISVKDSLTAKGRAKCWAERLDSVLNADLPFQKIGIAHLTCSAIGPGKEKVPHTLAAVPDSEMERLFSKAARLGVSIELNSDDMEFAPGTEDAVLRVYRIARACGCKFYCGSDAHHPERLERAKGILENAVSLLGLTEDDKPDFLRR